MRHEYLAAITLDGRWDAIFEHDVLYRRNLNDLENAQAWDVSKSRDADPAFAFWNEYIPEHRRVYLYQPAGLPIDRVIAIDPLGDGFYPVPHILCDIPPNGKHFIRFRPFLASLSLRSERLDIEVVDSTRSTIFPIPLPNENAPPPKEFDDTSEVPESLSIETEAQFQILLQRSENEADNQHALAESFPWEQQRKESQKVFFDWRTNVALPVLSAFSHKLKNNGHEARVIAKPEELSIELRSRLANPAHRFRGHVRISTSHFTNEWVVDIAPSQQTRDRPAMREKANAATTVLQLEGYVLSMLERLKKL